MSLSLDLLINVSQSIDLDLNLIVLAQIWFEIIFLLIIKKHLRPRFQIKIIYEQYDN